MKIALVSVVLTLAIAGCGGERAEDGTRSDTAESAQSEDEIVAFVGEFMKLRQAGLPADEFLSTGARAAYQNHARGGLWLYDDTLPGGPGGEYVEFSVDAPRKFTVKKFKNRTFTAWHAFVRIGVDWTGDAPASDISERLTIGLGPSGALVVLEARRTGDLATDGLPLAVAEKREAIYRAGVAHDYETLRSLLDPDTFSYSFGESGDPIGYWRRQEKSEIPILGDILSGVMHTRFGINEDIYVWPSAAAKLPSEWTDADVAAMRQAGYTARDIRAFEEQVGGYAGWRVGIRADGTWLYFISGD